MQVSAYTVTLKTPEGEQTIECAGKSSLVFEWPCARQQEAGWKVVIFCWKEILWQSIYIAVQTDTGRPDRALGKQREILYNMPLRVVAGDTATGLGAAGWTCVS